MYLDDERSVVRRFVLQCIIIRRAASDIGMRKHHNLQNHKVILQ